MLHTFFLSTLREKTVLVSENLATNYRISRLDNQKTTIGIIIVLQKFKMKDISTWPIFYDGYSGNDISPSILFHATCKLDT